MVTSALVYYRGSLNWIFLTFLPPPLVGLDQTRHSADRPLRTSPVSSVPPQNIYFQFKLEGRHATVHFYRFFKIDFLEGFLAEKNWRGRWSPSADLRETNIQQWRQVSDHLWEAQQLEVTDPVHKDNRCGPVRMPGKTRTDIKDQAGPLTVLLDRFQPIQRWFNTLT